jgi:uncharacterized membrane protein YsdA (DUF1294 family)
MARRVPPFRLFGVIALLGAVGAGGLLYGVLRLGWLISAVGAINVITLTLYAYDKAVVGGGYARVPESVLHLLALLGGSPAALAGQQLLRHKTSKRPFQTMFWCIVALQVVVLVWCFRHR